MIIYLMMKNKDMSGDCAFIASAVPTSKSIVSVELVTGSNASSKSAYSVVIDNKPSLAASE